LPHWFRVERKISVIKRWRDFLDPIIDHANARKGMWTEDEDLNLKAAVQMKATVQMHGGKDWAAIAAMVPGRTKIQCSKRWRDYLDPSIDRAIGRTGEWTEDEDLKLKAAVQMHGGKNWVAIAALVPGRTKSQCNHRWHRALVPPSP
jgi:hypothetical protein